MFGSHEATLLRDEQSLLRDEQSLLRNKQSLLRDKQSLLRDKQSLLCDEQSLLCDEQTLLRGKTNIPSLRRSLLRRGNTHKHQPLNKRRTHHGHKIRSSSSDFHEPKRSPDRN